jgi:hypothetical protein
MDFLRGMGGIFASGIVRLLVVGGTLVLVYLFIVRPVLDTTKDAFHTAARQQRQQQRAQAHQQARLQRSIRRQVGHTTRQAQRQVTHVFHTSSLRKQEKLLHCIQRSAGDVNRMQACGRRYSS